MRPRMWEPPVEPSPAEQAVIRAVRRGKLMLADPEGNEFRAFTE